MGGAPVNQPGSLAGVYGSQPAMGYGNQPGMQPQYQNPLMGKLEEQETKFLSNSNQSPTPRRGTQRLGVQARDEAKTTHA
ncbi:hypothetical protein PIB30_051678 [Stylosanthes scabra]|uniref:Uncharacterized protein n=1 Tax=Stylosanthes scabra TaxID=79078 RepID=A0ABU6TJ62_9FABA|nr:hypothetical protein [Stylosanthes scabra]